MSRLFPNRDLSLSSAELLKLCFVLGELNLFERETLMSWLYSRKVAVEMLNLRRDFWDLHIGSWLWIDLRNALLPIDLRPADCS